ncbi:hypothetical protein [Streptomyces sp. NPDC046261]|uniref:hypothetical protein n=1 Tax=Streptomyces sp. NPDC046261 TaxID=3157200 RepID=UPI0033DA45F7
MPAGRTLLVCAVTLATFTATTPPARADAPPMPAVRAYDHGKPLPSYEPVLRHCARAGCAFRINPDDNREYTSAVTSIGNAIVNCTDSDIVTKRTVTLETSSTDNIGGEISGSATVEGTITTTAQVNTDATKDVVLDSTKDQTQDQSHSQWGAQKDKGPTTEDVTKTGTKDSNHVGTKDSGHIGTMNNVVLGAKAAFQTAFKSTFSHQWVVRNVETTDYTITVKPHDIVVFSAANAMARVKGRLSDDRKTMYADDITVDSPSTVNSSVISAQSFTMPNKCLTLRPKGRAAAPGVIAADPDGLLQIAPPPPGTKPSASVVLVPEHRRVVVVR